MNDRDTKFILQQLELIKERCNEARNFINQLPPNERLQRANRFTLAAQVTIGQAITEVSAQDNEISD